MSRCKPQEVVEAIRLVGELSGISEELSPSNRRFVEDLDDKFESLGDKTEVTSKQLAYLRQLYERHL